MLQELAIGEALRLLAEVPDVARLVLASVPVEALLRHLSVSKTVSSTGRNGRPGSP